MKKSRSPSGMTTREARATTKAKRGKGKDKSSDKSKSLMAG
jgi:hypothetical protein